MLDVTYLLNITRIVCMCKIILKLLAVAIAVCCLPTNSFSSEWRLHPSFDRNPLRIIDTPEDTYFLVHQQVYHKNINGYNFPSLTLFRYDKNAAEKGITSLGYDVSLSSADIRMADYSPTGGYLIIIYNDGGIDLIGRDNELVHIDQLKRFTIPGMAKVTSVSFEPATGDAWVGTNGGYMHIDANTYNVREVRIFDQIIDRICRFGNKLVAISGNAAWMSDTMHPLTFNEFKKISSVVTPSTILPLADNEFAFVYGAPGATRTLKLAKYENSIWNISDIGTDNFYSIDGNEAVVNRYETNFIPNKDGYLIYSASKAWQLYAPKNGEATKLVSISLDSNPISLGSWDFSNFWCYRDRGTFVPRHADFTMDSNATSVTATWTDMQDPIRPDAPAAYICTYMDYSPKYGLLLMNHGHEWELGYNAPLNPVLLSSRSLNRWSVYSHAYTAPESVEQDAGLKNTYVSNINRFPLPDPNGLIIDPANPDWICCGSMFGGIMFQDLRNIKKDVIRFGAPNDIFKDFPYFAPHLLAQTWGTLSNFSPPSYDTDGTVWSIYSNAFEKDGAHAKTQLKYLTLNDRNTLYTSSSNQIKESAALSSIDVPYNNYSDWNCKIVAAKFPDNKNLIIMTTSHYDGDVIILDHKGTLEDTTDDEYKIFKKIVGQSQQISTFTRINDIVEDPVNGNIIISTMNKAIAFNPRNDLINGMMPGDVVPLKEEYSREIIPEACHVNKIIFDSSNRMWIGTNNQGVVGVSEDRKSVIARYNTSNSPLPSDCVYGLGWNPETSSLMISTKLGLAEVFPEVVSSTKEFGNPMLSISHIRPDYNGYVEIRNISPDQNIIIRDSNGIEVKRLGNGNFRNIEWDLKNEKGEKVKAGSYKIYIADKTPLELMIMSD